MLFFLLNSMNWQIVDGAHWARPVFPAPDEYLNIPIPEGLFNSATGSDSSGFRSADSAHERQNSIYSSITKDEIEKLAYEMQVAMVEPETFDKYLKYINANEDTANVKKQREIIYSFFIFEKGSQFSKIKICPQIMRRNKVLQDNCVVLWAGTDIEMSKLLPFLQKNGKYDIKICDFHAENSISDLKNCIVMCRPKFIRLQGSVFTTAVANMIIKYKFEQLKLEVDSISTGAIATLCSGSIAIITMKFDDLSIYPTNGEYPIYGTNRTDSYRFCCETKSLIQEFRINQSCRKLSIIQKNPTDDHVMIITREADSWVMSNFSFVTNCSNVRFHIKDLIATKNLELSFPDETGLPSILSKSYGLESLKINCTKLLADFNFLIRDNIKCDLRSLYITVEEPYNGDLRNITAINDYFSNISVCDIQINTINLVQKEQEPFSESFNDLNLFGAQYLPAQRKNQSQDDSAASSIVDYDIFSSNETLANIDSILPEFREYTLKRLTTQEEWNIIETMNRIIGVHVRATIRFPLVAHKNTPLSANMKKLRLQFSEKVLDQVKLNLENIETISIVIVKEDNNFSWNFYRFCENNFNQRNKLKNITITQLANSLPYFVFDYNFEDIVRFVFVFLGKVTETEEQRCFFQMREKFKESGKNPQAKMTVHYFESKNTFRYEKRNE